MQASILENFHSLFWPIVSELICPVLTRNLTLCPFLRFDLDLKTCSWNSCPEQQHHPSSTAYTCVQEPPLLVFLQSAGKRNWERIPGKTDFRTNLSCSWALTYGTDPSIPNYSYHITHVCCPHYRNIHLPCTAPHHSTDPLNKACQSFPALGNSLQ